MTAFVESFSTQQMLPPWRSEQSRYWGFVIRVGDECIQRYLDEFFNVAGPERAPYHYTARGSDHFGLLVVADHARFSSAQSVARDLGMVSHRQVFWSFPSRRYTRRPDNLLVDAVPVWTQPFGFDNNSYILFSSREIWGSEKQMATIHMESGEHTDDLHIDVAVQGFKKFAPRERSRSIGVMHMRMTHTDVPADLGKLLLADSGKASFSGALLGSIPLSDKTQKVPPVTIDTLKQFRDVHDMEAATYRAIVSSQTTHSNFRDVHIYSGENIALDFMWSDSSADVFTRLFGLQKPPKSSPRFSEGDAGPHDRDSHIDWDMPFTRVPVDFAVSFTADSLFEAMGTLHTYGVQRTPA